jgi:AcrR family transcriptional regulator
MLRPGPGIPRGDVVRSQRERLFGATVTCVARNGYEATTVANLLELSGVSRSAFYRHFTDMDDCCVATFEAVIDKALGLADDNLGGVGHLEDRGRGGLRAQLEMVVHQPNAAKFCFSDIYMVGERGRRAVDRATGNFEGMAGNTFGRLRSGDESLDGMVHGMLGGVQTIIQTQLRQGTVAALPGNTDDLLDWALAYESPSPQLRLAGRRTRTIDRPRDLASHSQPERLIRALAASAGERGYPTVTIAEIAARASVSQATFHSYFVDKDAVLLAALDSAGSQMLGVVMPAARRAPDWPNGIRAAIGSLCAFYAAEPDLARLAVVETYAAGPAALELRDHANAEIQGLLNPGLLVAPAVKQIVADAVFGAMWTLLYAQIVNEGPQALPQIAPLASYMVLAPFLGMAEAVRVSNGDGRGQSTR